MNYNTITLECKRKKIILEVLAEEIGMTRQGLSGAIKKKTLKVKDLEAISGILNVPITYWWDDQFEVNENAVPYSDTIRRLNRQIDGYLDDIERYKMRVSELENQYGIKKEAV